MKESANQKMLKKKPLLSAACVCECILFYFLFYFVLFVHTLTFTFILITAKHTHCDRQCDQIGRIFAQWVIAYFGQFSENHRSSPYFCSTCMPHSMAKLCICFDKNVLGHILGDFFHKPIWSPCPQLRAMT
jgi:hypothetical protein